MGNCTFKGCTVSAQSGSDIYCIFHTPIEGRHNKGEDHFRNELVKHYTSNTAEFNCNGFIFSFSLNFDELCKDSKEINKKLIFTNCSFKSNFILKNYIILGGVSFNNSRFEETVTFEESTFLSEAEFRETIFSKNIFFDNVNFVSHSGTENEIESKIIFSRTEFNGILSSFYKAKFGNVNVNFEKCNFDGELNFDELDFNSQINIEFVKCHFSEKSIFTFLNPHIKGDSKNIYIKFKHIVFPAHRSRFESIDLNPVLDNLPDKVVLFRYCILENVFFNYNNLKAFSFFKSIFDSANFTANDWHSETITYLKVRFKLFSYPRNNVLFEEKYFEFCDKLKSERNAKSLICQSLITLEIDDLFDDLEFKENELVNLNFIEKYDLVAAMYRKLRNAMDSNKNYPEAGSFYFNEFEMMRKMYTVQIEKSENMFKEFILSLKFIFSNPKKNGKWLMYSFYKNVSGYGEKPYWAFCWLLIFSFIVFPTIYLFIGFDHVSVNEKNETTKEQINYDLSIPDNLDGVSVMSAFYSLINDYCHSIELTFSKSIPKSYQNFDKTEFISNEFTIGLLNTTIIIFLIVMIAVGIKRHFRRF